jgi:hypothetical protein
MNVFSLFSKNCFDKSRYYGDYYYRDRMGYYGREDPYYNRDPYYQRDRNWYYQPEYRQQAYDR